MLLTIWPLHGVIPGPLAAVAPVEGPKRGALGALRLAECPTLQAGLAQQAVQLLSVQLLGPELVEP